MLISTVYDRWTDFSQSVISATPHTWFRRIGKNKFILGGWEYHEKGNSSWICRYQYTMCMWKWNRGWLDQNQYQCWNMFQVPSIFYRQTETNWHSGPDWAISQEIRKISESRKTHVVYPRLPILFSDKSLGRKTESGIAARNMLLICNPRWAGRFSFLLKKIRTGNILLTNTSNPAKILISLPESSLNRYKDRCLIN